MAVQMETKPKDKGVLTIVVQGSGQDLNHAASREAEKMTLNGMLITRTSDVYMDKGGNPAVDLEWKIDPEWESPEHPVRTFHGHIARLSQPHPESEGKKLVNDQSDTEEKIMAEAQTNEVAERKASSTREVSKTAGRKGGEKPLTKRTDLLSKRKPGTTAKAKARTK